MCTSNIAGHHQHTRKSQVELPCSTTLEKITHWKPFMYTINLKIFCLHKFSLDRFSTLFSFCRCGPIYTHYVNTPTMTLNYFCVINFSHWATLLNIYWWQKISRSMVYTISPLTVSKQSVTCLLLYIWAWLCPAYWLDYLTNVGYGTESNDTKADNVNLSTLLATSADVDVELCWKS